MEGGRGTEGGHMSWEGGRRALGRGTAGRLNSEEEELG